jgi:hypothetical protein
MECDYHYLVMSDPQDVVKYSTRSDALAALHKLVAQQAAAGFTTRGSQGGRLRSSHPDGRTKEFWIDDAKGDIVRPGGASTTGETAPVETAAVETAAVATGRLEIVRPTPSIAHE